MRTTTDMALKSTTFLAVDNSFLQHLFQRVAVSKRRFGVHILRDLETSLYLPEITVEEFGARELPQEPQMVAGSGRGSAESLTTRGQASVDGYKRSHMPNEQAAFVGGEFVAWPTAQFARYLKSDTKHYRSDKEWITSVVSLAGEVNRGRSNLYTDEARKRLANGIPPGTADAHKKTRAGAHEKHLNDAIFWLDVLDAAKSANASDLLLLTEDGKSDWRAPGKQEPNVDLVREAKAAGLDLRLLDVDDFVSSFANWDCYHRNLLRFYEVGDSVNILMSFLYDTEPDHAEGVFIMWRRRSAPSEHCHSKPPAGGMEIFFFPLSILIQLQSCPEFDTRVLFNSEHSLYKPSNRGPNRMPDATLENGVIRLPPAEMHQFICRQVTFVMSESMIKPEIRTNFNIIVERTRALSA